MQEAFSYIAAHPEFADFETGADKREIEELERALGTTLPASYHEFLEQFGTGDFNGQEFYGIIPGKLHSTGIPSTLWINKNLRAEVKWPVNYIVIGHTGYGAWYCLDYTVKDQSGECAVCQCDAVGSFLKLEYNSFEEFFRDKIINS